MNGLLSKILGNTHSSQSPVEAEDKGGDASFSIEGARVVDDGGFMNGLLSKILGNTSSSQSPVEAEDASFLREGARVIDTDYSDFDVSRLGELCLKKVKSWFTWGAQPKYGQLVAVARAPVNIQDEDNSCGVFPSTKLEDVVEISAACSSDVKEAMAAHTSGSHGDGQRSYGGGFASR